MILEVWSPSHHGKVSQYNHIYIYKLSSIYHQRMVRDSCHQGFPVSSCFPLFFSTQFCQHVLFASICRDFLHSTSGQQKFSIVRAPLVPWWSSHRRVVIVVDGLRGLSDRHGMDSFRWLLMPVAPQWSACHVGCYIEPWICQCKGNMGH